MRCNSIRYSFIQHFESSNVIITKYINLSLVLKLKLPRWDLIQFHVNLGIHSWMWLDLSRFQLQFTLQPFETWWFGRKISFFSKTCEMAEIFVIWQKNCLCLTSIDDQIFKSFWKPNPWMNFLEKKIYCISFYSSFCRASPFHREWPQFVTILTSFDLPFEKKFISLKY